MSMTSALSKRRMVGTATAPTVGVWAHDRQDVILNDAGETDEALVARVAAGDRRAYGLLVDRHLDRTVTIAHRILNNQADAEDVAQEAFLRLWRHADRFDPGAARFSTWFYRVTTNLCLDRTRRPPMATLEAAGDPADPAMDQERSLADRHTKAAVAAAVADLPDRLRAAVTLTYDGGLSNAEAAKALDVSVKALESLLVRARRALREKLAGWGT
ncbi:RNA polymerase sigma factor [Niveispirillum sp. KHB5.9]|uniref:RNA polymerase sigma factor n=1 Tax=Niveispirillum sp. KHB5.9 TaxID=3400269 RepID=UPI003A84A645